MVTFGTVCMRVIHKQNRRPTSYVVVIILQRLTKLLAMTSVPRSLSNYTLETMNPISRPSAFKFLVAPSERLKL